MPAHFVSSVRQMAKEKVKAKRQLDQILGGLGLGGGAAGGAAGANPLAGLLDGAGGAAGGANPLAGLLGGAAGGDAAAAVCCCQSYIMNGS